MPAQPTYDRIGHNYDTTRRADPFITSRLLALLDVPTATRVLDLACGSGNYTAALARAGLAMTGVDQSRRMIDSARQKSPAIHWHIGSAEALPFADASFDGALCTLAMHHFADLPAALREIRRVLRSGRFVAFTASRDQMCRYWLNEYFPEAMRRSIDQMPDLDTLRTALHSAGFTSFRTEPYEIQPDLQDFFLYSGKHRPEIYLVPHIRAGISTFALLANPAEIESGCTRLAADITSGHIHQIIAQHTHPTGDYLFLIAEAR